MKLVKYSLQNWGPHKSQSLEFPASSKTIAICGENDRGKSWIVRGIGFTLSIGRNEYGDQSSIHCGEQQAYHELIFEHGNKTYKIEKEVNGKGLEEEGTTTKIDGVVVNRSEYEEFYTDKLGLPHPSIWLPICISMQNQTDFHLRSKKRDREEALRAICQLNKIDSWKDSLNQLQKGEDRLLLTYSSKTKGTLEQIESELTSLDKKLLDQTNKLEGLKAFLPYKNPDPSNLEEANKNLELGWDEIISRAKSFENSLKETQRKTLERGNIVRQSNLLENAIMRNQKELEGYAKNLNDVHVIEEQKELYRHCLHRLRLEILSKDLKQNTQKKNLLEEKILENDSKIQEETLVPNPTSFKVSDKEQELAQLTQHIFNLTHSIKRAASLKLKLAIETPLSIDRIKAQIKNKAKIKQLLVKGLIEIKTLSEQENANIQEIDTIYKKLSISKDDILDQNNAIQSKLASEEIFNLSQLIRAVLWNKIATQEPQKGSIPQELKCPVCNSLIDESNLGERQSIEAISKVENSNLKYLFNLEEKFSYQILIKEKINQWKTDFECQEKLELDISGLELTISNLEQLLIALENLYKEGEIISQSKSDKGGIETHKDLLAYGQTLLTNAQNREIEIRMKIQAFNTKNQLKAELTNVLRENERINQQIEFYDEENRGRPVDLNNNLTITEIISTNSEEELKNKIQSVDKGLSKAREAHSLLEIKRKEIIGLQMEQKTCSAQIKELNTNLTNEEKALISGYNMPLPKDFKNFEEIETNNFPLTITDWEAISIEWQRRENECHKINAVISSIDPRRNELKKEKTALATELKESERSYKQIASMKKLISFLDYKNAPRKLLEGVVTNLFELTNKLGESLDVDIKLKLGKSLEFLTVQSRAGKWIEQKTERLGYGKGAILGICFRLACQKLLLPDTGFLILDEPTANVDIKRKGLFKMFLQNLSQEYPNNTQSHASQIILIEHDEDVVELCQTKVEIKEQSL